MCGFSVLNLFDSAFQNLTLLFVGLTTLSSTYAPVCAIEPDVIALYPALLSDPSGWAHAETIQQNRPQSSLFSISVYLSVCARLHAWQHANKSSWYLRLWANIALVAMLQNCPVGSVTFLNYSLHLKITTYLIFLKFNWIYVKIYWYMISIIILIIDYFQNK